MNDGEHALTHPPRPREKQPAEVKKIVFFGLFGQQNLGNDCSLHAIIEQTRIRLPNVETGCVCTGPEEIGARYGIPVFPMYAKPDKGRKRGKESPIGFLIGFAVRAWREWSHGVGAWKFLKGSDMFIVPGTGLLVDHTTGYRGYPFYLFKWSLIARWCGCRSLIISIGAGPIDHPLSRWLIKSALSWASYRSYRDDFSRRYIESIGFKTGGDPVYPDLAFSLPKSLISEQRHPQGPRPVIGVGVVDHSGPRGQLTSCGHDPYRDYLNKSATFIAWLLEHDYPVRMLLGDIKYDSRVKQDLIELLGKQGLNDCEGRIINEKITSLEDLISQLERIDIVISPRFHNIILALMLSKPVIVLSHHYKFDSLMDALDLADYCLAIDGLDVNRLTERFVEAVKDSEALRTSIKGKCEEYRRALDHQYDLIFGEPGGPARGPSRDVSG